MQGQRVVSECHEQVHCQQAAQWLAWYLQQTIILTPSHHSPAQLVTSLSTRQQCSREKWMMIIMEM